MPDDPCSSAPAPGPLPDLIPAPGADDPWLRQIVPFVESAIDELVRTYVEHPFIHRVEHSLHAQLYRLLTNDPDLAGLYPLGTTGYKSGLVHKEWPETTPRADKATASRPARRGNFDLAIVTPQQLLAVTSIEQFTRGTIAAPIVIELGLGYGEEHLAGDAKKLLESDVPHPYLVHFSHVRSRRHVGTEEFVLNKVKTPLQIAYVRHDLEAREIHLKERTESAIKVLPDESRATR